MMINYQKTDRLNGQCWREKKKQIIKRNLYFNCCLVFSQINVKELSLKIKNESFFLLFSKLLRNKNE